MKVFAYIGSPRGNESLGKQFIEKVKENVISTKKDIMFNVYVDSDLNILSHTGQTTDFALGKSIYDDDMKLLENEMLSSDVIIFASPVYAHNVSGQMKRFIDRISYWCHIFRLTGKIGYVVSVSDNNGNDYVTSYLKETMQFLGLYVAGETNVIGKKIRDNVNIYDSYVSHMSNKILSFETLRDINIPYEQEKFFESHKQLNLELSDDNVEKQYWREKGYFECATFEELFDKMYNN